MYPYEAPEATLVLLRSEDILTESAEGENDNLIGIDDLLSSL